MTNHKTNQQTNQQVKKPDLFTTALTLRFTSHASALLLSIVIPLAIYNLTGNKAMAGFSLLVEWIPKILVYLYSGQLLKVFSIGKLFSIVSTARFASIFLIIPTLEHMVPWWCLIIVAVIYQLNAAFFNLAYELNMSKWTTCSNSGHARLLFIDNAAGIMSLLAGIFIPDLTVLTIIAGIVMLITLFMTFKHQSKLFGNSEDLCTYKMKFNLMEPFLGIKHITTKIAVLLVISTISTVPAAIIFPIMPFLMEQAFGKSISTEFFSASNLVRLLVCVATLHFAIPLIKKYSGASVFLGSLAISLALILVMVLYPTSGYLFLSALIALGAVNFLIYPWTRSTRQVLMNPLSLNEKTTITGLSMAISSLSYIFAGVVVSINLPISTLLWISFGSVVVTMLVFLYSRNFLTE